MGGSSSKETRPTNGRGQNEIDLSKFNGRVDCVTIKGLDRTKDDYVQRSVKNLFKARNFEEILFEAKNASSNLNELGIFSNVRVLIDVSKGDKATANGYEVTFTGKELSRVTGTVGTTVDNNEGALTVELNTPNILGRGEQISVNGSYSTKKTNDVHLRLWKGYYHTVLGDFKPETSVSIFRQTAFYPWSKYKLNKFGLLFDFSSILFSDIKQSYQYEVAIKELQTIGKKEIPFFIREQAGPQLSSVFRYILAYDTRDSSIFPTDGVFVKSTNEMNVYTNGGINHVSNTTHGEFNVPLFNGMSAQVCGRVGVLKSRTDKVSIDSKFILGGPLSVRGFKHAGIGPREENCTVGTSTFWAAGLHLWSPLPFANPNSRFSQLFKTHLFYNCGNTERFSLDGMRSACGLGLAIKLGGKARIELNYCHPIYYNGKTDSVEKGFQFGIGYDFL